MLSVTTAMPPRSSICIMSDVPERGSPDTMMISFSTGGLSFAGIRADQILTSNARRKHRAATIETTNQ